jgi:hypothetical protein
MLIGCFDALLIHDTSRRRSKVPNPALPRAMHVIREREKCIAGAGHPIELPRVVRTLLRTEWRWNLLEQTFPLRLLTALERLTADKEVDRVCLFRTLDAFLEGQPEDARMVSQPPIVRLGARESRAVDPRLLSRTQSDDRPVISIRHAVGLGVFQG